MSVKKLVGMAGLFLVLFVSRTEAATLYISPNNAELMRGDTMSVAVRVDTDEGECVNAVDAVITYSDNIELVDTSRGNSILSVWLEEPKINKENRTVTFAGGIPNGYCGRIAGDPRLTNTVIELLFRSPAMVIGAVEEVDDAIINFGGETRVLLNDGFGSDAPLRTFGTVIKLLKRVGNTIVNEWSDRIEADTTPPEEFTISLERNSNAFSNKYYIVFNTTDKQSGVDHYEVIEESFEERMLFRWGAVNAPWVTARSPYLLSDQSLNSTIRVKAIDKAGNEYIASLVPEESQRTLSTESKVMLAVIITLLIIFILGTTVAFFWYRRRRVVPVDKADIDEKLPNKNNYDL